MRARQNKGQAPRGPIFFLIVSVSCYLMSASLYGGSLCAPFTDDLAPFPKNIDALPAFPPVPHEPEGICALFFSPSFFVISRAIFCHFAFHLTPIFPLACLHQKIQHSQILKIFSIPA